MGVYYGTVSGSGRHTKVDPPLVRTHTSNPAFPTGCGLGGFVTFAYGAVGRRGRHPIEGAIPLPPFGRGFDVRLRAWQRWAWQRWAWQRAAGGCAAVSEAGGGSGGQRRVLAGVAAVGSGAAGGGSGGQRRVVAGVAAMGSGGALRANISIVAVVRSFEPW